MWPRVEHQDLLRLPWRLGARPPAGVDCWSLVREWFARSGVELPEDPTADLTGAMIGWMPVERPYLVGDVLTMRVEGAGGVADHVGVIVGQEMLLHATERLGVVCEPAFRALRRFPLVSHLRRIEVP